MKTRSYIPLEGTTDFERIIQAQRILYKKIAQGDLMRCSIEVPLNDGRTFILYANARIYH